MFLGAAQVADHDRGQRIGALQPHEVVGVELEAQQVDAGPMRDEVAPVRPVGRGKRRRGDAEVDRAAFVGQDEEFVAAIVDAVAHAFFARRDQARRRLRIGEVEQPLLRRVMVAAADHAEAAAGTLADRGEPAAVLLLVDQDVVGLRGAEAMTEDLQRPMIVVLLDVEEERGVAAPDDAPAGALNLVRQVLSGRPIAHLDREIFRAAQIGAPRQEPVIR